MPVINRPNQLRARYNILNARIAKLESRKADVMQDLRIAKAERNRIYRKLYGTKKKVF